jgi:hypothetical protein
MLPGKSAGGESIRHELAVGEKIDDHLNKADQ